MTQSIVRMFPSAQVAGDAVKALTAQGFNIYDIHVVTPVAAEFGTTEEEQIQAIASAVMRGFIPKYIARIYAVGIRNGGSLVIVHAPFGFASTAIVTLEGFGPIDSGYSEPVEPPRPYHEGAPLSSALGWPLLLDDPTPFSNFIGFEALTKGAASISKALGLPLLLNCAAPFSQLLGLPTRSKNAAPFSKLLGLPVLSNNPTPFSSALKLKVLTD